jgi:hypothetical protein
MRPSAGRAQARLAHISGDRGSNWNHGKAGAGERKRTLVFSLEVFGFS